MLAFAFDFAFAFFFLGIRITLSLLFYGGAFHALGVFLAGIRRYGILGRIVFKLARLAVLFVVHDISPIVGLWLCTAHEFGGSF